METLICCSRHLYSFSSLFFPNIVLLLSHFHTSYIRKYQLGIYILFYPRCNCHSAENKILALRDCILIIDNFSGHFQLEDCVYVSIQNLGDITREGEENVVCNLFKLRLDFRLIWRALSLVNYLEFPWCNFNIVLGRALQRTYFSLGNRIFQMCFVRVRMVLFSDNELPECQTCNL